MLLFVMIPIFFSYRLIKPTVRYQRSCHGLATRIPCSENERRHGAAARGGDPYKWFAGKGDAKTGRQEG